MREWVKRNVKCRANSAEICHFLWTGQNTLVKIKNLKAKIISKNSKAKIPGRFLPNKVSVLEGSSSLLLDLSAAAFKSKRSVARSWGGKLCKDICEQPAATVFLFCSQGLCQSFSGGTFRFRHFSHTLAPRAASSCQREETTLDSLPGGGPSESQVCGNCFHVVGCAFVFV